MAGYHDAQWRARSALIDSMRQLDAILSEATRAINPGYFQIAIDGGPPVYRERVYCYELYHQMRVRWPDDTPFWLNGELDKAAHPIIRRLGADGAKPDFLIHTPGDMNGNHAIMEVKPVGTRGQPILDDLEKLCMFVDAVGYRRAIYLFYGYDADERLVHHVADMFNRLDNPQAVEVWIHAGPGEPAKRVTTLPILPPPQQPRAAKGRT